MHVCSIVSTMPHSGKYSLCLKNMKSDAEQWNSLGNNSFVTREVFGPMARCLTWISVYESFSEAMEKFESSWRSDVFTSIISRIEANPASDVVYPMNLVRSIYGELKDEYNVDMLRTYSLKRNMLPKAMEMIPRVASMAEKVNLNVTAWAPITGEDMSSMTIMYSAKSLKDSGMAMDNMGMSEEFQEIIRAAAEIGDLKSAYMQVPA